MPIVECRPSWLTNGSGISVPSVGSFLLLNKSLSTFRNCFKPWCCHPHRRSARLSFSFLDKALKLTSARLYYWLMRETESVPCGHLVSGVLYTTWSSGCRYIAFHSSPSFYCVFCQALLKDYTTSVSSVFPAHHWIKWEKKFQFLMDWRVL